MAYESLRGRVAGVLADAGFYAREDTIPTHASGGTFYLKSGRGVEISVDWWDAIGEERRVLLGRFAVALADAGFDVEDRGEAIYVAEPE